MIVGGILGIMFVTVLRRVMVEDRELPFPESVAASEIHKAGQRGSEAAASAVPGHGRRGLHPVAGQVCGCSHASNDFVVHVGEMGRSMVRLGFRPTDYAVKAGGTSVISAPAVSPAYVGVGYIIGPDAWLAELRGRASGVGAVRAVARVLPGPPLMNDFAAARGLQPGSGGDLGGPRQCAVAVRGSAHRGRRHARGGLLHPLPHAEEPRHRDQAGRGRPEEVGRRRRGDRAHRARPELQGRAHGHRGGVRPDGGHLQLLHGQRSVRPCLPRSSC